LIGNLFNQQVEDKVEEQVEDKASNKVEVTGRD